MPFKSELTREFPGTALLLSLVVCPGSDLLSNSDSRQASKESVGDNILGSIAGPVFPSNTFLVLVFSLLLFAPGLGAHPLALRGYAWIFGTYLSYLDLGCCRFSRLISSALKVLGNNFRPSSCSRIRPSLTNSSSSLARQDLVFFYFRSCPHRGGEELVLYTIHPMHRAQKESTPH